MPFGREHLSPAAAWSQLQALYAEAQEAQRIAEAGGWDVDDEVLERRAGRV